MLLFVFSSIVVLILSYLASKGVLKGGLKHGFIILALISAFRYQVGNDYMNYYEIFNDISRYQITWRNIFDQSINRDAGWTLLCMLFKPFGFYAFMAFVSVTNVASVYFFIKRCVPSKYLTVATYIYVINWEFFLFAMTISRQMFAMSFVLFSYLKFKDKKYIQAIVLACLSCFFHTTAFIVAPFLLLTVLPMKNTKLIFYVLLFAFILLFINADVINSIFEKFLVIDIVSSYERAYSSSDQITSFGVGFLFREIPFFYSLYYLYKNNDGDNDRKKLIIFTSIGALIVPFGTIIQLLSRISLYFTIFNIASVPLLLNWSKNKGLSIIIFIPYFFILLFTYFPFFTNSIYSIYYINYHYIFELLSY